MRDRRRYLHWVFEAKKRFGLCVLNYIVTCNHIHLLVKDTGPGVIAESMQLIAGRTAQEYNQRKNRQGAFWEDRYHATVVEADEHLHRCVVYIDLNMVRVGVVNHPGQWNESGFCEIQEPPKHYTIIDLQSLSELSGFADLRDFQRAHRQWVEQALENGRALRDNRWSESVSCNG
jgi:putative transposase